jgi:DNA-binding transcriptional MerR regulator
MNRIMFSIGEFSKITGLTVKALRFYHEEGLLIPSSVDPQTGYRYYDQRLIEPARIIAFLRKLEFPLAEIKALLKNESGEDQLIDVIHRHRKQLQQRVTQYRKAMKQLDAFIAEERQPGNMNPSQFEIQEKQIESIFIAGIRMKGRYEECGKAFGRLARALGRHIAGKPFLLHYDDEYKEEDADFEACMPIRNQKQIEGISIRPLQAARCVSLLHKGPYEQMGRSYAKAIQYLQDRRYKAIAPTREIYIKGPGMIFKGNPKNYLTEIQILFKPAGA